MERRSACALAIRRVRGALVALLASGCAPLVASFDLGGDEPRRFAQAVAGGDPRGAYDLLCPATRFGVPFEAFRSAVEANPYLLSATGVEIDSYRSLGGEAVVKEGWIESGSGVADAQFHVSKQGDGWCVTGVVIGGTPALPVPGTSGAGDPGGNSSPATGVEALARLAGLPAALRNDAFRAYGLSNPATRRYRLRRSDGDPGQSGSQRAELVSVDGDVARFRIVRSGALGAIGSLEVALEADGIHLIRSSQGALVAPTLLLPARLSPGRSWQNGYEIARAAGGTIRYRGADRIVGRERIRTAAGEFDALKLESEATVESGSERGTVRIEAWYADDVGSVRIDSVTTPEAGEASRLIVELVDAGGGAAP